MILTKAASDDSAPSASRSGMPVVAVRMLACIAKSIAQTCRATIMKLQTYTRPAALAIKDLRAALRANDQIRAIAAYNAFSKLMDDFKSTAIANGVT